MKVTGYIELDSVTFERGVPSKIDLTDYPKYLATEMGQIMGEQWGYAKRTLRFKPFGETLGNLADCRKYHANFLLNVGPMRDGTIPPRDMGYFEMLGVWMEINGESVYGTEPADLEVFTSKEDFILHNPDTGNYYLYLRGKPDDEAVFEFNKKIRSIRCLDEKTDTPFVQYGNIVRFKPNEYEFGTDLVVRVAKIETEEDL